MQLVIETAAVSRHTKMLFSCVMMIVSRCTWAAVIQRRCQSAYVRWEFESKAAWRGRTAAVVWTFSFRFTRGCHHSCVLGFTFWCTFNTVWLFSVHTLWDSLQFNCWQCLTVFKYFYPRDAMLARVIAIATCLSVCLSLAGIVSKRRKLAAWFLHQLVAPRL